MAGASVSPTLAGPPERIRAEGCISATCAAVVTQEWISEYTPASRTRRAMSWVTWEP